MNEIEIKLPSDPQFLKIIRSGISHISKICGFSNEESNAVTIAVDEAASNIIKHTYNGAKNELIVVNFRILEDRLEVVLRDFGEKVDPKTIKSRDLNEIRPGGLGVHLIKSTMDVVNYDNSFEVGNQLTMVKYFPGKKEK
ncbi:ATP-binding protein [candidate division KSB1 bacterium]|nr:ATP-binding protein [candidate division KSB1 bacterium]MCH7674520.1 ATP-binding protein [candidate division KSB1 bacterium]MCH7754842.1 ATP-binding protein [candidate division KSB1 bacterium]